MSFYVLIKNLNTYKTILNFVFVNLTIMMDIHFREQHNKLLLLVQILMCYHYVVKF